MQLPTAMFAVYGIPIVPRQAAVGTFIVNFVGPKNRLRKPKKQRDTHYHDDDGEQPARLAYENNVSESRRCECRNREIECIKIVIDRTID